MSVPMNVNDIYLSNDGYRFFVAVTGYKYKPYKLSDGSLAVGFKHTGPEIVAGKTYTDEEIYDFFMIDKEWYENDVRKIFDPRFMSQHMFDAMFSFAYSVGNISNTDLGRMIKKNPYDDRIVYAWQKTYTNGLKNRTLMRRRKREVEYYFTPDKDDIED